LFLLSSAAHAQMYKCVDERGKTQYSDKPCAQGKGGEVDIRGQPPISGRLNERRDNVSEQERDFQRRQIQRGREEEAEARRVAAVKQRCATLRSQLDVLQRYNNITRQNAKGEREFMDDATRDARIAQLKGELTKCPD
jgi:hypothetical protein